MPRLPLIWSLWAIAVAPLLTTPLMAQEASQAPLSARVIGRQSGLLKIDVGAESGVVVGTPESFGLVGLVGWVGMVGSIGVVEVGLHAPSATSHHSPRGQCSSIWHLVSACAGKH